MGTRRFASCNSGPRYVQVLDKIILPQILMPMNEVIFGNGERACNSLEMECMEAPIFLENECALLRDAFGWVESLLLIVHLKCHYFSWLSNFLPTKKIQVVFLAVLVNDFLELEIRNVSFVILKLWNHKL
ncbi:uncharacterized protein LOC133869197 isoform X2 [Alnus glutinosa]|uniref:uncharacterized protein LOC133869197 isoform X2 n=1 Tax=Alnus glutinosa TaxID=3517 RepID=UPI002D785DF6|nr:uncharacterized protein LOC133869197 isoform X2 [Alnus glutinosa]